MDEQQNQEILQPISANELEEQKRAESEEMTNDAEAGNVDTQDGALTEEISEKVPSTVREDTEESPEVSNEVDDKDTKEESEKEEAVPEEKSEEEMPSDESKDEQEEMPSDEAEEKEKDNKVDEVEELRKQVEEFQFEKEEREGIQELQTTVQNAQVGFADFESRVNAALRDALMDNKIDLNKSLEEIRKDDPAQYKVAMDLINQAEAIKQQQIAAITRQVQDVQNKLIFKRAEREFNKFDLTDEEAEIAADTFINIMRQVGIDNLKEDLKAKVSLAVGQGKLLAKGVKETAEKVAEAAGKVEEKAEQIQEALIKPEAENEKPEVAVEAEKETDKTGDAVGEAEASHEEEQKAEGLKEAMDDPVSQSVDAGAPAKVDDPSVLSKLASFKQGSKEQLAFYKEHYGEINRAMQRFHREV